MYNKSQYLFISHYLCFLLLSFLFCQPYTVLFSRAFCQSVIAIYGHMLCSPLLSTTSAFLGPKQSYRVGRYLGNHCLAFGLQTPYGWCQTILNIFFVKLLLCKSTWIAHQIYLILSSPVASDFFIPITVVGLYVQKSSVFSP
jgi:hypothetical protein